MARLRLRKTLMDYMVIAITPALIILLVGSLTFFLLTVFYDGLYDTRLRFIFSCFVFAIVLIARISIEEGKERAVIFAIPLAIAMFVAVARFSDLNILFNICLIGLIWWSTNKLTWDSTVIDDEKDSSGEGLLQKLGLDASDPESTHEPTTLELEATTSTEIPQHEAGWTQQHRHQQKGHTPGRWVIYFSLAALPLFGFGQLMIPAGSTAHRQATFNQLLVYVAAGIGLLMTTSFLGLRRYLRQRQMEMPHDVSGVWLGIGSAMIAGILLVCGVLPRPQGSHSVSRPFVVGSVDRDPNRWGPFDDGPEDDQQANQSIADDEKTGQGAPKPGEKGSGNQGSTTGSGTQAESDHGAKGKGKKSQSGKKGKPRLGKGQTQKSGRKSQTPKSKGRGNQKGKQSGSTKSETSRTQNQDNSANAKKSAESNSREAGNQPKEQQNANPKSNQQEPEKSSQPSDDNRRETDGNKTSSEAAPDNQSERSDRNELKSIKKNRSGTGSSRSQKRRAAQRNNATTSRSGGRSPTPPNAMSSPLNAFGSILSGLGLIAKLLFWLILFSFACWWLWNNRAQVMKAWQKLLKDLADFWSRLFGHRPPEESPTTETVEHKLPARPFASFQNPFASGLATNRSVDELVRYSFQAVESWSRERGYARSENQTPLEFARQVADLDPGMRTSVVRLGNLYSCAAYANRTLNPSDLPYLKELWNQLEAAPPPVPLTR
ncbi:MAG: DUF4129 domain-containing protein [Planctomycetota bacterium]|nr:DUF4129 domain-containing protein [Planctomycetota bacterium]